MAVVSGLALLWARSHPRTVLVVNATGTAVLAALDFLPSPLLPASVMAALYWLADRTDRATTRRYSWVTIAVLVVASLSAVPFGDQVPLRTAGITLWLALPIAAGSSARLRRACLESVQTRAAHAERTREEEARLRVAEERMIMPRSRGSGTRSPQRGYLQRRCRRLPTSSSLRPGEVPPSRRRAPPPHRRWARQPFRERWRPGWEGVLPNQVRTSVVVSSSHHRLRRTRSSGRAVVVSAVVAAVGLVVVVGVLAFRDDGEVAAGSVAASSSATSAAVQPKAPWVVPSPVAASSTAASASPTPSPAARTSSPAAVASKRPSPTPKVTSLAGRIEPGVTYRGIATFYDTGDGDGACTFGPTDDTMTAAMNHADYETSKACGAYVRVSAGGASVTVRVTNECPECGAGDLDLSPEAFAKLADPVKGRISVSWRLVSPSAAPAAISLRYKTGSSAYWCGVQVIGHRNPVARLELRSGSGWTEVPRAEYNYFLSERGTGCGGAIRVTDIYGERLTVEGIAVRPDVTQSTDVQFAVR